MSFPTNEEQTIQLFRLIQNRIGWHIVESQSNAFPDAVLESDDGERLSCEFEHLAKNFHKHGHPVDDSCDLIICWQNDWPESPLPVMALQDCAEEEAKIIEGLLADKVPRSEFIQLRNQAQELQRELIETEEALEKTIYQFKWEEEDLEYFLGSNYENIMFELALKEIERQHGLPEQTFEYKYEWLPQTKQETKIFGVTKPVAEPKEKDSPSQLEKALAAIILLVLVPALVILLVVK